MDTSSISTDNLLIELGTEELPPTALLNLSQHFGQQIINQLQKNGLSCQDYEIFATPRRLAILIQQVQTRQADQVIRRKGPSVQAAFDKEGKPTRAALGFARSCRVAVNELGREKTDKGEWLCWEQEQAGQPLDTLIEPIIQGALDKLPIPKRMRWGDRQDLFVRPAHWLLVILGDKVLDCTVLSLTASRYTYGHRFMRPDRIRIDDPLQYKSVLRQQGKVIANFTERREMIEQQILEIAEQQQAKAVIDPALLDEVCAMVEWPVAICGSFDADFLKVPPEALISAMKKHQKYFHLLDQNQHLLPLFITIANIDSNTPEVVRQGNERVIRPRLADAAFFWQQDVNIPLQQQVERLRNVVFQNRLGSLYDKTMRVVQISSHLADYLSLDQEKTKRVAFLSRADLLTEMINEFPDLQGIMGRYYAHAQGEDKKVAIALDELYLPRFSGDNTSSNPYAQVVSLADRMDTLCGIFAIGLSPSGDKDPFALRRASLGILRTLIENRIDLSLSALFQWVQNAYPAEIAVLFNQQAVFTFINERLRGYALEQGFGHDLFDAVSGIQQDNPLDSMRRLQAIAEFLQQPQATDLAAANKRISNIMKKNPPPEEIDINQSLLQLEAEQNLYQQIVHLQQQLTPLLEQGAYRQYLLQLAPINEVVNHFFDQVMVMAEDPVIQRNRLALIAQLRKLFLRVADFSLIQTASKG